MIVSRGTDASEFENSPVCKGVSYGNTGEKIDGALISVSGRYPASGFLINQISKELVYITKGSGMLLSKDRSEAFEAGDVVYIDANEAFAWDGRFEGFFATTPKFDPAQHTEVAE